MMRLTTLRPPLLAALLVLAGPARAQNDAGPSDVPGFDAVLTAAEDADPDVARARAELARAEAEVRALGPVLPNPELEAEVGFAAPWGEGGSELAVGLSQPLPVFGTREAALAAARARVRAAEARLDLALRDRQLRAREAAAALAGARDVVTLREELAALAARITEATRRQVEAGELAPSALHLARIEGATAAADEIEARRDVRLAEVALCAALALDPCLLPALPTADALDAPVGPRPEIVAADEAVAAAGHDIRAARAARVPTPTVGLGWVREEDRAEGPFRPEADQRLEVSVSFPLPLWSSGEAEVAAARANLSAAEAEREALVRASTREVREAEARLEAAEARHAAFAEVAPAVAETLGWLARGFEAGALSLDAYLAQRDRLVRAELARTESRRELAAARLALVRARGASTDGGPR